MLPIESAIPIPPKRRGNYKYPIRELEVGQSFFVEGTDVKKRQELMRSVLNAARRYEIKITCRIIEGGVRVWRTE